MGRAELDANLVTQCQRLRAHLSTAGTPCRETPSERAAKLSSEIYLSHATKTTTFAKIAKSGNIYSRVAINKQDPSVKLGSTELQMGTADCVFFYAAPFRFPRTTCGFLFAPTLEEERCEDGAASPFDSGGLVHHIQLPPGFTTPSTFLREHEFPIPGHRDYLCLSMDHLFDQPESYLEGMASPAAGCLGLSGGDNRMWTHEVRLAERVDLRSRHLRAVFAHRALPASNPAIQDLFKRCLSEGIDWVAYEGPEAGAFKTLQRECISYMQKKLY